MTDPDHFNRDAAFSFNVKNPNAEESSDAIQRMLELDGSLFCFSELSISTILTADTIDPGASEPSTRHGYQILYSVGSRNKLVARSILQAHEILNSVVLKDGPEIKGTVNLIWEVTKHMLECENSLHGIYENTMELMPICDKLINDSKSGTVIPTLPQVPDLQGRVTTFLANAKRALEKAHRLLYFFFQAPSKNSNFKEYRDWMRMHKSAHPDVIKLLEQDAPWITFIADARNALDTIHAEPGYKVVVENFKLCPGNKFAAPSWSYDFSRENRGLQHDGTDLLSELDAMLNNILGFLEELYLLCIRETWDDRFPFALCRLPDDQLNKQCPIPFFVSLSKPRTEVAKHKSDSE
jgi:hypothetical protein